MLISDGIIITIHWYKEHILYFTYHYVCYQSQPSTVHVYDSR